MKTNFIINALLVTSVWILPILVISTLLDQLMPKVKEDEKKVYTLAMIVIQIILVFLLYEGFEKIIRHLNNNVLNNIKRPELVNGAIILSVLQSNTQKTLSRRLNIIYYDIDKKLEKIGIE